MPSVAMKHEVDPREALLDRVGDLSGIEVFANDVLVAIYKRPEKTKSGIYLTDVTRGEDVHQGKVGLIISMGPLAFVDDENLKFRDEDRCHVGDFVWFRPSDGWRITLNTSASGVDTVDCRVVKDVSIRGRVSHPDLVY